MSRARSDSQDSLLLIAATAILILTAQHYFKSSPQANSTAPASSPDFSPSLHDEGRDRQRPRRIPTTWAVWKQILWRTYQRSDDDRLLATAGGVVFFGLLAVFPAVTALVSSYGLFADSSTIGANLQSLALMLPDGSFQIVEDQIARVLEKGNTTLGWTFFFGLAFAIWSANAGVKAIIDALNVVDEAREQRSFLKLNLISLAFTTGGIAAMILMVSAVVAFPLALGHFDLSPDSLFIVGLARWPLMFGILLVALTLLYRFGPSRRLARWELFGVGTIAAALLWIAGSAGLSWYLSNFANYNATYGSLGAAIGLMTWMWMSAIIVLFGAELNSEVERQSLSIPTSESPRPPRGRDAPIGLIAVPAASKEH